MAKIKIDNAAIEKHLRAIDGILGSHHGYVLTLVCRHPSQKESDIILTAEDDLNKAKEIVDRWQSLELKASGPLK